MQAEAIAAIEKLTSVLESHQAALQEYLAIEHAKRHQSDWMTPEEAALELGLTITKSNYHRRRINAAAERFGIRMSNTRPRTYWREDIHQLSRRLRDGKAII
ncbi:MAG: hypothetical protein R2824_15710 [Saprospiraceae bacterium]